MRSIDARLDRLEIKLPSKPNMVVYETDADLSAEEEATFLSREAPGLSPTALVISRRRAEGGNQRPPAIVSIDTSFVTHEDALLCLT